MNHCRISSIFLLLSFFFQTCSVEPPTPKDLAEEHIIPKPLELTATGSSFALKKGLQIVLAEGQDEINGVGEYLAQFLRPGTGLSLPIVTSDVVPRNNSIYLSLEEDSSLGNEGYHLNVTEQLISLKAQQPAGLFYGVQTLRQLLPASLEGGTLQEGPWEIATGTIKDVPTYGHRGSMLDVARHFFGVEDVKQYIDYLALYKMNVLHLHLSDDQGWRIEIKSWPNLTTHGGSTEVGGGAGGFFTQEEYKEIVKYAQDRFITIIPEIDMPGHTNAALASYPELNCDDKARELYTGTEVGFSTLCVDKEVTYKFVDDVIRELAAMTPGPYIHIGGDESHVTEKDDYIVFIQKTQEIVASHNKLMMGWDEIVNATLNKQAVAQYWASEENAGKALEQDVKILVSPAKKAYLDMKYDSTTELGLSWAGLIEIDTGYIWDPESMVEGMTKANIIGVEAPLWGETVTNMDEVEYMLFPRLPGYAEIGWTPKAQRSWEDYKVRLANQKARFEVLNINYYKSDLVPWPEKLGIF